MSDQDPIVDPTPEELAAAEATEAEIDAILAGRAGPASDPTSLWLAAAMRVEVPDTLRTRVDEAREAELTRRARPARIAAGILAYLYLSHGIGNFFVGGWVADNLDQAESPHALTEGSLALIAVGLVVALGATWRRWLPAAATAGVPLAVLFGVVGLSEAPTFGAGAALHLSQAAAGIGLGYQVWKLRGRFRDKGDPGDEGTADTEPGSEP